MKLFISISAVFTVGVLAQLQPLAIPEEDQQIADQQAKEIYQVARGVTKKASKVVFPIFSERRHIGYAISLGEGKLVAKASEVVPRRSLVINAGKDGVRPLAILGAYPEQDIVLLEAKGLKAPAADWADGSRLLEGSFLVAVTPDGEPAGVGVKSVASRSLRQEDQGFLGVRIDPRDFGDAVEITSVERGSAAEKSGLRAGDMLLSIIGEAVKGFQEISTRLRRLKVGETPEIRLSRQGKEFTVSPVLQGSPRKKLPPSRRLEQMDRGSGTTNRVSDDFSNVIQSDMELEANHTGLPVVDLEGRIIGLVIARAGRISTLILPSKEILEMLEGEPYQLQRRPRAASQRR